MQGSSHQVIPIFDGEKYDFRSIKMETIFRTRNLWSVVEEGVPVEPLQTVETPETARAKTLREEARTNDTVALQILQSPESTSEGTFYVRTKGTKSGFKSDNTKSRVKTDKRWCGFCKMSNHTEEKCWKKPKKNDQGNSQRSNKVCYKCGMIGHYSNVCRSKKREGAHVSLEEEDLKDDHMMFSASEESSTTLGEDVWLVDSGCTNHMTKEERYFSNINRSIKVPIRVGNGDIVMTAGKGDITVMTSHGKRIIKNVFLVPGLEKNLLSVSQIISSGYRVRFEDKRCIIQDAKGKKLMDIEMTNKSFKIKLSSVEEEAEKTKSQTYSQRP